MGAIVIRTRFDECTESAEIATSEDKHIEYSYKCRKNHYVYKTNTYANKTGKTKARSNVYISCL